MTDNTLPKILKTTYYTIFQQIFLIPILQGTVDYYTDPDRKQTI